MTVKQREDKLRRKEEQRQIDPTVSREFEEGNTVTQRERRHEFEAVEDGKLTFYRSTNLDWKGMHREAHETDI